MGKTIKLNRSNAYRQKVTKEQLKKIQASYKRAWEELLKKEKSMHLSDNSLQKAQINQLKAQVIKQYNQITEELKMANMLDMEGMSREVFEDFKAYYKNLGMSGTEDFFVKTPKHIVDKIINGKVYTGKWSYSKAIWGNNSRVTDSINKVVADGVAQGKSTLEIAKDLEQYVNPSRRKPWKWSKVYPGSTAVVDYNAQRMARTLVAHAYQQSIVEATKNNPFIEGIKWHSALAPGRTCQICRDRNGQIYTPDELPLDHPNGLCTMIPVTMDLDKVGNKLAAWVKGKPDKAIDRYAFSLFSDTQKNIAIMLAKQSISSMSMFKEDDVIRYTAGKLGKNAPKYETWLRGLDLEDKEYLMFKYSSLKNAHKILFKG